MRPLHKNNARSAWLSYLRLYRGHEATLGLAGLLAVGQSLAIIPTALVARSALDHALPAGDIGGLALAGATIIGLQLLGAAMALASRHLSLSTVKAAICNLRTELITRCYAMPRSFYDHADHGRLHAAIVHESLRLDQMSSALVVQALPATVLALALVPLLLLIDPLLFLVLLAVGPPLVLAERRLRTTLRVLTSVSQQSFASFSAGVSFALRSIDLTRTQAAERFEISRQHGRAVALAEAGKRVSWVETAALQTQQTITAIVGAILLVAGGAAVIEGRTSPGDLLAFLVAARLLGNALRDLAIALPHIALGFAALDALSPLLGPPPLPPYNGQRTLSFSGALSIECLSFGYDQPPPLDDGREVEGSPVPTVIILHDISLSIRPGEIIALTGPNGAGKSTLVALLLGLYRPLAGQICADGQPYSEIDLLMLRQQIGLVPQEPLIFSGSIWENLTYGYPQATVEEVERAACAAGAEDLIAATSAGYATQVGEGGGLLSGGQRQRLALARALLRRPRLLILDEPSNHLDQEAVAGLLGRMAAFEPAPAILIISHDERLLHFAQRRYMLHQGQLRSLEGQP